MNNVIGSNPATTSKQDSIKSSVNDVKIEVQDVEADAEALLGNTSLIRQSSAGGTQKLIIASNVAQGSAQACRSCLLHIPEDNAGDIHFTTANETADADDWLCPKGMPIPFPMDNLSDLHFYGSNDGDLIYIHWRN